MLTVTYCINSTSLRCIDLTNWVTLTLIYQTHSKSNQSCSWNPHIWLPISVWYVWCSPLRHVRLKMCDLEAGISRWLNVKSKDAVGLPIWLLLVFIGKHIYLSHLLAVKTARKFGTSYHCVDISYPGITTLHVRQGGLFFKLKLSPPWFPEGRLHQE